MSTNHATITEIVDRYASAIEAEMRALVDQPPDPHLAPLYGMMAYHLGWRDAHLCRVNERTGKWIRPAACLLACEAAGGDWHRATPAAAALELTHNFTLIHDDIQDGDEERRGRPTVWKIWGIPQAINAGDGLFVLARTALHQLHRQGFDPATIEYVYQAYDQACLRLVEGQFLDIDFERRLDVTVGEYLRMIAGKTAALLAACLEIGARLATADLKVVHAYHELGLELGLAFQIIDDILGAWGDQAVTGKSAGNDLRRKKKTLPVVFALQHALETGQQDFPELYQKPQLDDADVATARSLLEAIGAREYAQALAEQHRTQAMEILSRISSDGDPAQGRLRTLAQFLIERAF